MRAGRLVAAAVVAILATAACQYETYTEREERRAEERENQERVRELIMEQLDAADAERLPSPAPPAFVDRSRGKTMVRLTSMSSATIDYEVTVPGRPTVSGTESSMGGGVTFELIETLMPGTVSATVRSGRNIRTDVVRCQIIVDGWVVAEGSDAGGAAEASCSARAQPH